MPPTGSTSTSDRGSTGRRGSTMRHMRWTAAVLAAVLLLAGCGSSATTFPTTVSTNQGAGSPPMSGTAPPVMPSTSLTLSGDELRDAEYMATLIQWAQRDGYPLGQRGDGFPIVADRDELIADGHQVCTSVSQGESMISASADVMRAKGLSGAQAQAVGVAAVDVYCPENRP